MSATAAFPASPLLAGALPGWNGRDGWEADGLTRMDGMPYSLRRSAIQIGGADLSELASSD